MFVCMFICANSHLCTHITTIKRKSVSTRDQRLNDRIKCRQCSSVRGTRNVVSATEGIPSPRNGREKNNNNSE